MGPDRPRVVRRPAVPLTIGIVVFGALASAVTAYKPGGFGGSITAPAGTDSAAGTALLTKHFPASAANPTNLVYKLPQPVWDNPAPVAVATGQLKASGLFTGVTGPLNPVGVILTPAQYQSLHAALGDPRALPAVPPAGEQHPAGGIRGLPGHRPVRQPRRRDDPVPDRPEGR